jgi:orotidine-5'-phosphate decarboxylase
MHELSLHLKQRGTCLCLGLDLDPDRIPGRYLAAEQPLLALSLELIDATRDLVAAYKPNLAFFEQAGAAGWQALEALIARVGTDALLIADAKRGDIGNTSTRYARAFYGELGCHALTLAPYMGEDSLRPFFEEGARCRQGDGLGPGLGAFVLALTSNPGARDFQLLDTGGVPLYERVLQRLDDWNAGWGEGRLGAVVGATRPDLLAEIRAAHPELPLLIPGVGAQGGEAEDVLHALAGGRAPALVNLSRAVLYGDDAVAEPAAVRERARAWAARLPWPAGR